MRYGFKDWDLLILNNPILGDTRIVQMNFNINELHETNSNTERYKYLTLVYNIERLLIDILDSVTPKNALQFGRQCVGGWYDLNENIKIMIKNKYMSSDRIIDWPILFKLINIGFSKIGQDICFWTFMVSLSKITKYSCFSSEHCYPEICDNVETVLCKIYNYIEQSKLPETILINKAKIPDYSENMQFLLNIYLKEILTNIDRDFYQCVIMDIMINFSRKMTEEEKEKYREHEKMLITDDPFLTLCPTVAKLRSIEFIKRSRDKPSKS